ncbi:HlyD family secretion protein [Sungkyunkwania multivorans]|uniref:HlyD family secretion protein n=1 Tax=Sungkyunkwania multivorans TaxID=1173618 RepID=A0ABW3CYT9_9FLAO
MPENLEDIELRSEEVHEILSKVPHWMIRWGSVLFLSLIIMVLIISWFIKYPDIIEAEAIVTTQFPPQKEYAQITGKIDTILVKDNQEVRSNTPLAIIENSANFEDVFHLKTITDTLAVRKEDFYFPIEELPILFLGEVEDDFAFFENSYDQYVLNKSLNPFASEATANKYSILQLQARLDNLETQKKLSASEFQFKKSELDRNKSLFEKGVISKQEYDNKQLEYLQAERRYKDVSVTISQIKESISNARLSKKNTEINRTKEEKKLFRSVMQSYNQLKKAIKDWELKYVLKSNIDGSVTFLNIQNKNQTVNVGDLVFTIIPDQNADYVAKLRAPSRNSGKIRIGQTVNIKLDNYPDNEYGMLKGTVKKISRAPDSEGYYLIDGSLPKNLVTTYNKEIDFRQEMRGTAEIVTEDLRLIERFFYQFRELVNR